MLSLCIKDTFKFKAELMYRKQFGDIHPSVRLLIPYLSEINSKFFSHELMLLNRRAYVGVS